MASVRSSRETSSRNGARDGSGYAVLATDETNAADDGDLQSPQVQMTGLHARLLVVCFIVLGAGVLLPFNAVITPSEFYRTIFRTSQYRDSFMSWIIVAYNISCIIFGAHATATMPSRSVEKRIRATMIVTIVILLVATGASTFSKGQTESGNVMMAIILCLTVAISAATAYLQVAVVTLANAFGPSFLGSMLAGQGFVGVVVSCVQLFSAYTHTQDVDITASNDAAIQAATAFFAANSIMMTFVLICFWRLQRTDTFREMQERIEEAKKPVLGERTETISNTVSIQGWRRYTSSTVQQAIDRIWSAQRKSKLSSFCITYVFIITLAVFPSLTSRVRPLKSAGDNTIAEGQVLLFVAWHFVTFNVSDLLGRTLPAVAPNIFCTERMVLVCGACVLRSVLPSLLAKCNVHAIDVTTSESSFSTSAFFCLIVVLGLSNGLLATNIFIAGPRQKNLTSDAERSLVAGLLSWWLTVGLAIGSVTSFYVAAPSSA